VTARRVRIVGVTVAVATLVVGACIPPRPAPSSLPPTPSPSATASPTGSSSIPATGVVVDPTLLDLLPADIDGVPLRPDAETAADIAADGSIAPFVSGLAIAAAFGPLASDTAADYVVVTVARLKPNLFGDLFYRGWRDTFDAAVCEQAGGVVGHAEADIDGRHTFIGTCAGGVHTYHVHLPEQGVIVSMQGAGERRLGERVVAGLTE
jgi:hypothetical protein